MLQGDGDIVVPDYSLIIDMLIPKSNMKSARFRFPGKSENL